jgi:hypothetical protein
MATSKKAKAKRSATARRVALNHWAGLAAEERSKIARKAARTRRRNRSEG